MADSTTGTCELWCFLMLNSRIRQSTVAPKAKKKFCLYCGVHLLNLQGRHKHTTFDPIFSAGATEWDEMDLSEHHENCCSDHTEIVPVLQRFSLVPTHNRDFCVDYQQLLLACFHCRNRYQTIWAVVAITALNFTATFLFSLSSGLIKLATLWS